MKNLLIVLLVLFTTLVKAQPDVYLNRTDIMSSMQIRVINVQHFNCPEVEWNAPNGLDTFLVFTYSCGNFGNQDLIIDTNSSLGRVVTACFNVQMTVPEYVEISLKDYYCMKDVSPDNYKESFSISNSFHTPYLSNGALAVSTIEWDSIVHYGIPSASLGQSIPNNCCGAPYKMIISPGWGDAYSWSYYNNGIWLHNVHDGYYWIYISINVPPDIPEAHIYPNDFWCPIYKQGLTVKTPMSPGWINPPSQLAPTDPVGFTPPTMQGNKIPDSGQLSWIGTNLDCQYKVGIKIQIRGNQFQHITGSPFTTSDPFYNYQLLPGEWYKFEVQAINQSGVSNIISTGKYQTK